MKIFLNIILEEELSGNKKVKDTQIQNLMSELIAEYFSWNRNDSFFKSFNRENCETGDDGKNSDSTVKSPLLTGRKLGPVTQKVHNFPNS